MAFWWRSGAVLALILTAIPHSMVPFWWRSSAVLGAVLEAIPHSIVPFWCRSGGALGAVLEAIPHSMVPFRWRAGSDPAECWRTGPVGASCPCGVSSACLLLFDHLLNPIAHSLLGKKGVSEGERQVKDR